MKINKISMQISDKVKSIPEALSIYINQIVYKQKRKGKDITVMSLGEAFFDIPMFDFKKLDFVKGYHYSDSRGIPELREKIAEFYNKQYNVCVNPETELLISAGSKPIIYFAILAVLNLGDEVLIHEPGWLSYQEQVKLVDAVPKFINFDCKVEDFHNFFTSKTKMVIINNPNNPAGRIYTKKDLESLYKQCREKGIYILVDEAYSDFVIEDKFYSMANIVTDKDGIIVINSLSKNMGMSGWRVGYVITTPILLNQILKLNQHIITCTSTILQYYMAEYFDKIIESTLPQAREVVLKRQRIAKKMDKIGLKYLKSNSTFYFFVNIENFIGTSLDYSIYMILKNQVSVVPGSAYGKSTERFVRISIGTESEERIYEALLMMKDLINLKECDFQKLYSNLEQEGIHKFQSLIEI